MEEQSSSNKGAVIAIVVVAIILLIGAGVLVLTRKSTSPTLADNQGVVAGIENSPTPSNMPEASGSAMTEASPSSVQSSGTDVALTVQGGNYFFKPNVITVKKGAHVKITFTNSGGFHDFVIDQYNVKTPVIKSGGTSTVEFTADKAGTFQFYCSVANHRQMGMVGNLIVQ